MSVLLSYGHVQRILKGQFYSRGCWQERKNAKISNIGIHYCCEENAWWGLANDIPADRRDLISSNISNSFNSVWTLLCNETLGAPKSDGIADNLCFVKRCGKYFISVCEQHRNRWQYEIKLGLGWRWHTHSCHKIRSVKKKN